MTTTHCCYKANLKPEPPQDLNIRGVFMVQVRGEFTILNMMDCDVDTLVGNIKRCYFQQL